MKKVRTNPVAFRGFVEMYHTMTNIGYRLEQASLRRAVFIGPHHMVSVYRLHADIGWLPAIFNPRSI